MKTELEKSGHSAGGGSAFCLRSKSFGGQAGGNNSAFYLPWPSSDRLPCAFLAAFTLIELMVAATIFGLALAGAINVYIMCQKMWHTTALSMQVNRESNLALARLVYGLGTNNGLRTASSINISNMNSIWTGATYPPAPGDNTHFLNPGSPDGSWRMTCSNIFDGTRWIDFNKNASNIVYCIDPPFPPTPINLSTRQLICNYVSAAIVSTNASGVNIRLTLLRKKGRSTSTNQIGTFVLLRNMS